MTRLDDIRGHMAEQEIDLLVLGPGGALRWLLDLKLHADERPLLVVISRERAAILMPALEAESARPQTDLPLFLWDDASGPDAALSDLLRDMGAEGARQVAMDDALRFDHAALLLDRLPEAGHRFWSDSLAAARMRKTPQEQALLKQNAAQADQALLAAWQQMRPGMTEAEVAALIKQSFGDQGAQPLFAIIGTGANGAEPHHLTDDTVLRAGDAVVMDVGGGYDGFSSDITRMALMGHPPEGYDAIHQIVEAAVCAALEAARPGARACDVDAAARGVITDAGYGEFFPHRTGHGLGIEVHEPPFLTGASQTVLEEGMVFSIEPGIYLPGRFGIRLEEIVILKPDGPELLSDLPRDAVIIHG